MVRCRVVVTGQVQGVWYRESCRREAAAAGVSGWIRNTGNSAVEAVLEGDEDAVARVLAWMRVGPPAAVVEAVDVRAEARRGEVGFRVC